MRRTDVRVGTLAVLLGIGISFLIDSPTSDFVATQENAAAIVNVDSLGPPVRWKLASVVSGNLVLVGTLGKRVEERIRVLSEVLYKYVSFYPTFFIEVHVYRKYFKNS